MQVMTLLAGAQTRVRRDCLVRVLHFLNTAFYRCLLELEQRHRLIHPFNFGVLIVLT